MSETRAWEVREHPLALTPEEWAKETGPASPALDTRIGWAMSEVGANDAISRHALAALALWGQPFGFTREDVGTLIDAYVALYSLTFGQPATPLMEQLKSLSVRIDALLPPVPPESPT